VLWRVCPPEPLQAFPALSQLPPSEVQDEASLDFMRENGFCVGLGIAVALFTQGFDPAG